MSYDIMGRYLNYISSSSEYYTKRSSIPEKQLIVENLSSDWEISNDETWRFYNNKKSRLPEQGWKIHVSSCYEDIEKTLKVVGDILINEKISFKHLKSKEIVFACYSKNANRLVSGKFITIYPNNEQFLPLLDKLYENLKDFDNGPYILTDKQWKDSNIYYRYGAFIKMFSDNNELCIKDPTGKLIPDVRSTSYHLPDFVVEPEKLKETELIFNPPSKKENKLLAYNFEKTIRYSNAGGIYLVKNKNTGVPYIIKEASIHDMDLLYMRKQNISYVPQTISYRDVIVADIFEEENILAPEQLIKLFLDLGIKFSDKEIFFIKSSWSKKVNNLSGGDKQFISILSKVIKQKKVIIFDEPTSNLDFERIDTFCKIINTLKNDKIILIISHDNELNKLFTKKINLSITG